MQRISSIDLSASSGRKSGESPVRYEELQQSRYKELQQSH
jgi:hypothetical protein